MRASSYIARSLWHYRRSHLAAMAGAAIATAALAGALLTGHSVRESLRQLTLGRLGETVQLLAASTFFSDRLAARFSSGAPLIALEAHASHEPSGRRVSSIDLFAIDKRFFAFHGQPQAAPPEGRDVYLSPALARELSAKGGDTVLVRVQEQSSIPREFLYGEKEETSRVLRYRVAQSVTPPAVPEFALRQRQGDVHAVYVSLNRLRRDLRLGETANSVLLKSDPPAPQVLRLLQEHYELSDIGLRLRTIDDARTTILDHASTILDDKTASVALAAGRSLHVLTRPFLTYLANTVRAGAKLSPYALVAAADDATLAELNGDDPLANSRIPPILLTDWLAADLQTQPGEEITLDYFVWEPNGELATRSSRFQVSGIVAMRGLAGDRNVAPEYPGITDQTSIAAWDPPFPVDLKLIRPKDEEYWKLHRATPKAWVRLETAKELWATRYGSLNSIRFSAPASQMGPVLRASIDPAASHFTLIPVRAQALAAAQGSTDFGEYFLYFSFVLVVAALLLMALFFRLAIEQRLEEIRLLRSVGLPFGRLRSFFLAEGAAISLAGALAGAGLGVAWGWLMMEGLRRWWRGATGTQLLSLHLDSPYVAVGAAGGVAAAVVTVWLTLRRYEVLAPRSIGARIRKGGFRLLWATLSLSLVGAIAFAAASFSGQMPAAGGFFASGALLLTTLLCGALLWLRQPALPLRPEPGQKAFWLLALKNTAWRPGRSLLCMALVALAAFLLVSLEAFRQHDAPSRGLWAETLSPIVQDPQTLDGIPKLRWTAFRLRPGDDISCLNLYQPRNPRILGLPASYYRSRPLPISASAAQSPETQQNPWLLLETQLESGHIPAIVDQNSMQYVLHKRLGDTIEIERGGAPPIRLRIVATTAPGFFQSEILIAEKDFVRLFPSIPGFRVFLIDAPAEQIPVLEDALANYGFDAQTLADRLASFHQVENTYLSTFQALGGFGLLIGVFGLAAVMLRNTLERRAELALLNAIGLDGAALQRMVLYENIVLLAAGLFFGTVCALFAVAPALSARAALLPVARIAGLIVFTFLAGCVASWISVRAAAPARLASALRGS